MKRLFTGLMLTNLLFSAAEAAPVEKSSRLAIRPENASRSNASKSFSAGKISAAQQNLIGEATAVDKSAGRITVKTEAGVAVVVAINEKTVFQRVAPGQTSIANAEQVTVNEITVGDRILVPGGAANEQTPVRRVIIMARQAITAQQEQERQNRRARTLNGRVTAVNPERKEITVQTRGRAAAADGSAETITVSASAGNVKFMRYAPDSLRVADAIAGSFNDLKVGDQIRLVGDRSADGSRLTAEEILFGSIVRTVGSIVEINAARNEVVVKNAQNGQTMTVALGKNTTLRRIPEDVAQTLKQRASERAERQRAQGNQQATSGTPNQQQQADRQNRRQERRENRRENRNANSAGGATTDGQQQQRQANRGLPAQFDNLPIITIAELKKGDAVLITGTGNGGADNARMTAVSIVTGEAELQQILQRTQGGGGRNGNSPNSPGLPGNVGGGNAPSDNDEPRNQR